MNQELILSVITPTYNRAALLKKCFVSLQNQTNYRFEWIIINDGSTDDTETVVESFLTQLPRFPIHYVDKENGGKHTALNASHSYIHGKYVLILDSDDTLTEDAVAIAIDAWTRWEKHLDVGIVTFLKGKDVEHPNCYVADENTPVDIMTYQRTCLISNDACEVIRKELFLKYPFPVFLGERFLSEGALWNRVSFVAKCVYINRVIYLCDYLEDGLTRTGRSLRIRNPRGGMYASNLNMAKKNTWKKRVKNGLLFTCYGCFAKLSPIKMAKNSDNRLLMFCCLPFGWLLYLYWRSKYSV